jgi:cell division protein FtsI/penicillin-binding protein 2
MRRWILGAALVAAGAVALALARHGAGNLAHATPNDDAIARVVQNPLSQPVPPPPPPTTGLDLTKIGQDDAGPSAPMADHKIARLTIDPELQRTATHLMEVHKLPEASVVMMDPQTGRVLVYASHLESGPPRDLCAEATAPAASVFKVVTGAALVENAGLAPDTKQCFSGGEQKILASDLEDDPVRDRWCASLSGAMGRSLNTVFARLALKHLKPPILEDTAKSLGFGDPLAFDVPVQPSQIHLPTDTLGFARTAAGFWNTTLSPLHAATLSSTIARGGEPIRPMIVSAVTDLAGAPIWSAPSSPPVPSKRAIQPQTAQALTTMMEHTVSEGTCYRAFHDAKGTPFLPGIFVAGKTGTLTDDKARRFYTWFTGFAPSRPMPGVKPAAIAVLVVNLPTWQVKANVLAREMLHAYFAQQRVPNVLRPARIAVARKE